MAVHVVRLPDVGEGVAQAELVSWLVEVGDAVEPDSPVAEILTDKANVEIYSPVSGTVAYLRGDPGDLLAVGSEFIGIELDGDAAAPTRPAPAPPVAAPVPEAAPVRAQAPCETATAPRHLDRPLASPAVRRAALERGVDLRLVRGSGPAGRILRSDLDAADSPVTTAPLRAPDTETPIRGIRRKIAERMTTAWRIPHITYVDEVDVTEVERLRQAQHERTVEAAVRLSLLPFVVRALVIACGEQPLMNSTFDDEAGTLTTHGSVHVGIATQTDAGLVVPVIRHAEAMSLTAISTEITRLADAARRGQATRDELSGSTITVTSLGRLGGLATTPIINHPEVAIVGVNKLQTRPMWDGTSFVPRAMVNLSSSFDHRVVDGWDAAVYVQRIKQLLETPALLFSEELRG